MRKSIPALLLALILSTSLFAGQEFYGLKASQKIKGAEYLRMRDNVSIPAFIRFSEGQGPAVNTIEQWIISTFNLPAGSVLEKEKNSQDDLGFTHLKLVQKINGVKVEFVSYSVHILNGEVKSVNGYLSSYSPSNGFDLNESTSLQSALNQIGASVYKWQIPEEETFLKWETGNPEATYVPVGEQVYLHKNADVTSNQIVPCWKFNIYANEPLYRANVYVNAVTGEIEFEDKILKHVDTASTGKTTYSGIRNMVTDYVSQNLFRLRETGRGGGIRTFDMNNGTSHGSASDITNDSTYWHDTLRIEYATDAHWGSEMVYDYYMNVHNFNSYDGNGATMNSYVHYGNNYSNAFWDGQRMTYGDGGGSYTAFTTIDIAGHEITHGVDQYTSNLVYQNESGALDESFADIFGNAVEALVKPDATKNWLVGEEIGGHLRSMRNPKSKSDPDTYMGTFYYTGTADNGGVHTNSGVQNHWFFLLSIGGSGTNDNNDAYSVTGITIQKAEKIAFRNRANGYLTSYSNYADARDGAIQSALDLYGPCSQELASTVNAWYAVGVGSAYSSTVVSDFTASTVDVCSVPGEVTFSNSSNYNAVSYLWDFGDGTTDTAANPTHSYMSAGTYTVKLTATGNSTCGSDVETKSNYINVSPPADVQVSPYTICNGYAARIRANAQNTAFWFLDSSDTEPVFIGNPYVSLPLSQDTFFYAANGLISPVDSVGPADNTIGSGSNHTSQGYHLAFDVFEKLTLESITVYSYDATYRAFEVYDGNDILIESKLVNVGTGEQVIELGYELEPGLDYKLKLASWVNSPDFFRSSSGVNFPYQISNLISIKESRGPNGVVPGYYYYFYNWKVKAKDCIGNKQKVDVTIDLDPGCIPYVGIEDEENLTQISVYPNPSQGNFQIDLELLHDSNLNIQLIDSKGGRVYSENNLQFNQGLQTYSINKSDLAKGIYLLQINGGDVNHSERLIIE